MPPPHSKSDAPYADVKLVKYQAKENEVIMVGSIRLDVLEDGSNTDRRLAAVNITVPPKTKGPAQHWHQLNPSPMHDETFMPLRGTATFTSRDKSFTAGPGDYVVVPPCSPHTFSNEHDEELVMYNTFSPAFYIDYFRVMAKMAEENGGKLSPEIAREAMVRYGTLQVGVASEW